MFFFSFNSRPLCITTCYNTITQNAESLIGIRQYEFHSQRFLNSFQCCKMWMSLSPFTIKNLKNGGERCVFSWEFEKLTDFFSQTLSRRSNTYCYEVSTFHRVLRIKADVHFNLRLQIYHLYNGDLSQDKTMSTKFFKINIIIWNNTQFSNDQYMFSGSYFFFNWVN